MDQLRDSFSKLVEKTLAMEDPRLQQSKPYSDNEEDNVTDGNDRGVRKKPRFLSAG